MLESLQLRGAPAFDPVDGVTVGPLARVNFLFGPNGSGKTTISRAFADPARFQGSSLVWDSSGGAHGVKVYNRDYVADTLKQAANLSGVFLLGATSAEIQSEIDGLNGPAGAIAATQKILNHLGGSLVTKQAEITAMNDSLKDAAWARRSVVPPELVVMFLGLNNSKENFFKRLVEVAAANETATEDFDPLKIEAAAVLAENAVPLADLALGRDIRLEDSPGFDVLATPVVGSGDVRLAPLIQQLQNADWVRHGRHFLDKDDDLCPFCQQRAPADLATQLDAYFDTQYTQQTEQLQEFQEFFDAWAAGWPAYFDGITSNAVSIDHLNADRFAVVRLQLEQAIARTAATIATKISGPSAIVTVASLTAEVNEVNGVVAEANASITDFNLRLKNRATAKRALLDRCWVVFARNTLATEVGRFEGLMPDLLKGRQALETSITANNTELTSRKNRLRELQSQVTSSKPVIDTINRLLESVGFHNFRLKESTAMQDGYSLVRENDEIAADTLSEGERTFITFLYFAQSLQGTPQESGELDDLVAVIDDPISSLDSDVLYSVSTLVRRIVADIAAGTGRVRQLVLLTHNAHFHKEITYKAPGEKGAGWQYGIVRKRTGLPSEVILTKDNPIQTAYGALWDEVKRASIDPSTSAVSLQNILRRILETYFKVLGGIDNPAIVEKFVGDDQILCRALFSWVNAGSHSIFDDLNYSPTPTTVDANLRVFRRIFVEHNQTGHYDMMMGELANTSAAAREVKGNT